jgi:pimeloyl-ACP methyl ester carboxylesterase
MAAREFVRRDIECANDVAALQNHDAITDNDPPPDRQPQTLSSINVPTLVIHGTADPLFPGHGVDEADWETITTAILEHTRV